MNEVLVGRFIGTCAAMWDPHCACAALQVGIRVIIAMTNHEAQMGGSQWCAFPPSAIIPACASACACAGSCFAGSS